MHRRALPIASPCQVFRPSPGQSFCEHCTTHVHDLSAMTRRQAEALLAANAGQKMCVAYRTKADGTLVHRPEARPLAVAALALGLAACTGHTPEVEYPGEHCKDPHGYEHDCDDARHGMSPQIPNAEPSTHDPLPVDADAEVDADDTQPIASNDGRPADAVPIPEVPVIPSIDIGESDMVGLVAVDYTPEIESDRIVGELMVDADEIRKSKRESKRAERRARRASR